MKIKNKYLNIGLVESKKIEKLDLSDDIISLLEFANKELEKYYAGQKYKFYISNENNINELKLDPKRKRQIKKLWLEFNSDLSTIQRKYEKFLQKTLQDDQYNV